MEDGWIVYEPRIHWGPDKNPGDGGRPEAPEPTPSSSSRRQERKQQEDQSQRMRGRQAGAPGLARQAHAEIHVHLRPSRRPSIRCPRRRPGCLSPVEPARLLVIHFGVLGKGYTNNGQTSHISPRAWQRAGDSTNGAAPSPHMRQASFFPVSPLAGFAETFNSESPRVLLTHALVSSLLISVWLRVAFSCYSWLRRSPAQSCLERHFL